MSGTDFERLNIILAARDREFAKALDRNIRRIERFEKKSHKRLSRTGKHFNGLAVAAKRLLPALSALAAINATKRIVGDLDDIGKTADKLGLTTDALQELRSASESAGVSTGTFDMAMQRFGRRLAEARNGTGEAKGALKELGIDLTDTEGRAKSMEAVLDEVADGMKGMSNQTDRNRIAMKLFDSEGVALVNLLRNGSNGMAEMRAHARELGIVIDEKLIREAEGAQTELGLMARVIKANLSSALIELAPLLVAGAKGAAQLARGVAAVAGIVADFVDPSGDLEVAISNIVLAMNDEILASQALQRQLVNDVNMSVNAAKQKLKEASARHKNAKAAVAEARALALGSEEMGDIDARVKDNLNAIAVFQSRVNQYGHDEDKRSLEIMEGALRGNLAMRTDLLEADKEMADQISRTADNIKVLEDALGSASGGYVKLGGAMVETVKLGDRLSNSTSRLKDKFSTILNDGGNYADLLARIQELYDSGVISGQQYQVLTEKLKDKFKGVRDAAKSIDQTFAQTASGIIRNSGSASDAVGRLLDRMADVLLQEGLSGLFGSLGLGNVLGGIFKNGFTSGGYTGSGGKYTPAGVVHKGEYVMDAATTRRIGVGNLESMRQGRSVAAPSGGNSIMEVRLGPGLEASMVSTAVGQSVTLTQMGLSQRQQAFSGNIQTHNERGTT